MLYIIQRALKVAGEAYSRHFNRQIHRENKCHFNGATNYSRVWRKGARKWDWDYRRTTGELLTPASALHIYIYLIPLIMTYKTHTALKYWNKQHSCCVRKQREVEGGVGWWNVQVDLCKSDGFQVQTFVIFFFFSTAAACSSVSSWTSPVTEEQPSQTNDS